MAQNDTSKGWLETTCVESSCNNTFPYHESWANMPALCPVCQENRKRAQRGEELIGTFTAKKWTRNDLEHGVVIAHDDQSTIDVHIHRHKVGITLTVYEYDEEGNKAVVLRYNINC